MALEFRNISAAEFVKAFEAAYVDALARWDRAEREAAWTRFMIGEADRPARSDFGLLGRMAKQLSCRVDAEYLRVDQVWSHFFSHDDPGAYRPDGSGEDPWRIVVAIEHENDPSRFLETLRKLGCLNVPLKVLVTYPYKAGGSNRRYAAPHLLEKGRLFLSNERTDPDNTYLLGFGPEDWSDLSLSRWDWYDSAGDSFAVMQV